MRLQKGVHIKSVDFGRIKIYTSMTIRNYITRNSSKLRNPGTKAKNVGVPTIPRT